MNVLAPLPVALQQRLQGLRNPAVATRSPALRDHIDAFSDCLARSTTGLAKQLDFKDLNQDLEGSPTVKHACDRGHGSNPL